MLGMNFKSFFTLVCWPGFAQDDNNIQVASGSPLPGVKVIIIRTLVVKHYSLDFPFATLLVIVFS